MSLPPVTRLAGHVEPGSDKRTSHIARRRVGREAAARRSVAGNLGQQGGFPQFGVLCGGKAVEKPGICLIPPGRKRLARIAHDKVNLDIVPDQGLRRVRQQRGGIICEGCGFRESRKGAKRVVRRHREGFETGETQSPFRGRCGPGLPRRDKVEAGAEAKLCDVESRCKPLWQAIALKEDMPRFSQPVVERVIRVIEALGHGHTACVPKGPVCLGIVHGLTYEGFRQLRQAGSIMVDVTVRGAGIFGLSVAWACVKRGASVRVIDPGGVAAGASGGLVGALAPHTPERWNDKKELQFQSLDMAEAMWADVADVGGRDPGYARTGRIQPVGALEIATERARNAEELWKGRYTWQVRDVRDFGAFAPVTPSGLVIHDTLTARANPRKATQALAAALVAKRVEILTEGREDGAVVHATGASGLVALSEALAYPVGVPIKGQSALIDFDARDLPQIFVDGLHVIPHADGTTAIGSTTEREFADPSSCDGGLDDILGRVVRLVPALRERPVLERWAGLRPRARSRAPMLGAWPGRPGHFIANGGFKIGFGMAPIVGQLISELILDGHDRIPDSFRVDASLPKP